MEGELRMISNSQTYRWLAVGLLCLLAAGLVVAFVVVRSFVKAATCRSKLMALKFNMTIYRSDHQGHWPSNLVSVAAATFQADVTNEVVLDRLSCPAAGHYFQGSTDVISDADYVYINWEAFFGTNAPPPDYPLFYDRRLSNHKGIGVNVVTAASCFWDYHARFLTNFAGAHPNYHLPMPE